MSLGSTEEGSLGAGGVQWLKPRTGLDAQGNRGPV